MTAAPAGGGARRRAAYDRGRGAERWAELWLRLQGYRVLARGFRVPQGEIDLIVRRGDLVAFVEVKRRQDLGRAAEAIGGRQRRRIERAAAAFLQRHPAVAACRLRFDALLLARGRLPRHLRDAWRP